MIAGTEIAGFEIAGYGGTAVTVTPIESAIELVGTLFAGPSIGGLSAFVPALSASQVALSRLSGSAYSGSALGGSIESTPAVSGTVVVE